MFSRKRQRFDREAAAEEVALARAQRAAPSDSEKSELASELADRLGEVRRQILVELYLTHYTNDQLKAWLDFYRSDVGRSILEVDGLIEVELQQELRARFEPIGHEIKQRRAGRKSRDSSFRLMAGRGGFLDDN